MPRGSKAAYSSKQRREARHIEESYEKRGVSSGEAARRAWATVNKQTGGAAGKKKAGAKKKATGKTAASAKKATAKKGTSTRKRASSRRASSTSRSAAKKSAVKKTATRGSTKTKKTSARN